MAEERTETCACGLVRKGGGEADRSDIFAYAWIPGSRARRLAAASVHRACVIDHLQSYKSLLKYIVRENSIVVLVSREEELQKSRRSPSSYNLTLAYIAWQRQEALESHSLRCSNMVGSRL